MALDLLPTDSLSLFSPISKYNLFHRSVDLLVTEKWSSLFAKLNIVVVNVSILVPNLLLLLFEAEVDWISYRSKRKVEGNVSDTV